MAHLSRPFPKHEQSNTQPPIGGFTLKFTFSKDTRMAIYRPVLGFMLDAYDMAMVLVMAPILVTVFASPKGSAPIFSPIAK